MMGGSVAADDDKNHNEEADREQQREDDIFVVVAVTFVVNYGRGRTATVKDHVCSSFSKGPAVTP